MADTATPTEKPFGRRVRLIFAVVVVTFCLALIVWLVTKTPPTTSLHESALGWSFLTVLAVLGGVGIAAITPALAAFKK